MNRKEMIEHALRLARAGKWKEVNAYLLEIYNTLEWQAVVQAVNAYKRKIEPMKHEDLFL